MEDKTKIDKLFEQGLGQFEAEPPTDAWDNIKAELTAARRKKVLAYWRIAGTAAAIVLAFFGGYYLDLTTSGHQPSSQNNVATSPAIENNEPSKNAERPLVSPGERQSLNNRKETLQENQTIADNTNGANNRLKPEIEQSPAGRNPAVQPQASASGPENFAVEQMDLASKPSIAEQLEPKDEISTKAGALRKPLILPVAEETLATATQPENKEDVFTYFDETGEKSRRKDVKSQRGFGVGLAASPTLAFSDVNANPSSSSNMNAADYESSIEKTDDVMNSYAGGLNVSYRTDSRWEFGTGVQLNNWKQVSRDVTLSAEYTGSSITNAPSSAYGNTSTGFVKYDLNGAMDTARFEAVGLNSYRLVPDIEQNYQFVDIPLNVGFYAIDSRRWVLKFNAGFTGRFLSGSDVNLVFENGDKEDYNGLELRNFSLQLSGGTGFGYKATENLLLNITPTILYGLTPVNQNEDVNTYFHQILIYSGVSYRF